MIQQNNNLKLETQEYKPPPGILLTNTNNINASSAMTTTTTTTQPMTTLNNDTKAIIELESNSTLNRALTTLLKKSFFEQKPVNWRPVKFELVINSKLTDEFTQIKSDFQKISKELQSKDPKEECDYSEKYGFLIESDSQVNFICQNGYSCTETSYNSKCGVYVCKYVDTCLKYAENKKFPDNLTLKMILFKTCYGRHTTTVIRKANPRLQPILPTVGFNSHSSVIAPKEGADIETLFDHSQIYLYELYNDKASAKKPRNCLPYAVVTWLKFNDGTEWPHNFDELEGDVNLLQTDTIQVGLGTDDVYLKNKLKDILKANEEVKCENRNEYVNEANGLIINNDNNNNNNNENVINNGQNNNSNTCSTAENNDTNNITSISCDVANEIHNNNQEIENNSSQTNKINHDNLNNEQTQQQITTENGNNEDKSPLNGYNNNNNTSPNTTAGGSINVTTSANNVSNPITTTTTNVNNNSQNGSTTTATTIANTTVTTSSSTNNTNTSVTTSTPTNPTTTSTVSSSISVPSSNSYYNKSNGSHYQKQMHSYPYRQNPGITPYILTQAPSPYSTIRLPYLAAQASAPTAASLYATGSPYGGIATQGLQQQVYLCRAPNGGLTYITAAPSAHMLSNQAAAQAATYLQQPSATTYAAPPTAYKIPTVNQLSSYQSQTPQQSQPQQQIIYQAAPQPAQTSTAAAKQNMIPTANNIVVQPQQTAQALQAAATNQQQAQAVAQAQVNVHAQHAPPTQSPKQNTAPSATTQQQTTQFATQYPGQNHSALYATQNQINQQMQQLSAAYQGQPTYVTYAPSGANNIATSLAGQTYYANPSSYIVTQSGTQQQLANAAAQGGVYGYTTQLANVTNGYATQNPANGQISMTLPSGAQAPAGYQIIDYRQVGGIPTAATTVQLDQFAQSATGLVQRPRYVNVKYHPYPRN